MSQLIELTSSDYKVQLSSSGAEIRSVRNENSGVERMWQADSSVWGRTAPVLFPIVGKLKNNTYRFNSKEYSLPQHGFARDQVFEVMFQSSSKVVFELRSNNETRNCYPFEFILTLTYELINNILTTHYQVQNSGTDLMYFSLGAHPGFIINLKNENVVLLFNEHEDAERFVVNDGLISSVTEKGLKGKELILTENLFANDALVFKDLNSSFLEMKSGAHCLKFSWEGFPFFGIWKKPIANFVCLEPWAGIADHVNASGLFTEKEGILSLKPNEMYHAKITMEF